jgi:hypothetical protein
MYKYSTHNVRVKTYSVLSMKPHLNQSQDLTIKNLIGREDVWMLMSRLNRVYLTCNIFCTSMYVVFFILYLTILPPTLLHIDYMYMTFV